MSIERPIITPNTNRGMFSGIGLAAAVTPSNTTDLPGGITRTLYVCAEGSLRVTLMDMEDGQYVDYPTIHPGRHQLYAKRIWATTTAQVIAEY